MIRWHRAVWALAATASLGACDLLIGARDRERSPNVLCGATSCDCAEGFADCDGDPDNGCETDAKMEMVADCDGDPTTLCDARLLTDSAHCGTCERDCLDGACANGMCVPQQVPNGDKVFDFIIKGADYYYTSQFETGIFKSSLTADGAPKKIGSTPEPGRSLVLYKDVFYFSTDTQVMSMPFAGGKATALVTGVTPIIRVAAGGDKVYWVNLDNDDTGVTSLMRVSNKGGMPEMVKSFPDPNNQFGTDVVATDTEVYFEDYLDIARNPHSAVSVKPFVTAPSPPVYYFLEGDKLYTDCIDVGIFYSQTGATGKLTQVVDARGEGTITTDKDNIYYLSMRYELDDIQVWKASKASGEPVLLAASEDIVWQAPIAVDDKYIYWVTQASGIRRVAK